MTISQTTVLVARSDPEQVDRLAERLREHWAVRTAYDTEAAVEIAGDEVDVAVVDDGLPALEEQLLPALHAADGCRIVLLTGTPGEVTIPENSNEVAVQGNQVAVRNVDRALVRSAETDDIVAAVQEVRLRARYHDLVEHYYDLAVERSTLLSKESELAEVRADELGQLLDGVRSEIDGVIETLSERNAFSRLCRELSPDDEQDVGDLEAGV